MLAMAEVIQQCAKSLTQIFDALQKSQKLLDYLVEINTLEEKADTIVRQAVQDLFESHDDPMLVMKLKEIYDFLEQTVDSCEDVCDVLQNVVVKNS